MKFLFTLILNVSFCTALAQGNSFKYGQITYKQFEQKAPNTDTSAVAIVLKEFGEAHISDTDGNMVFEHHYLIKILKQSGVEEANITIPVYKNEKVAEKLHSIKASSYNLENYAIHESALNSKNIFTENQSEFCDNKKFTIPNVRVGSIIEVSYTLETPFFTRNFRTWEFQSHLPKISSEFWASIPGNYIYYISLKGYHKLKTNESEILKNCFNLGGGMISECVRYKYAMVNIPAFVEEDHMTAKSNFLSSVNFELKEIKYFDGRVDKVTSEWKDADKEMTASTFFGDQLKKGKEINKKIEPVLLGVEDPLEKAKKIYDFVKTYFRWNGYYSKYSDEGIKKAIDAKSGDIADINLTLIAALRNENLNVEPLILSTRENGAVTELFPVLSDFNYVVAKLNLGEKIYLLDASDALLPFGMLPERCLNGKGRVFPDKEPSYWYDLRPTEKYKKLMLVDLVLEQTGILTGSIQQHYYGYQAYQKRQNILSYTTQDEYLEGFKKKNSQIIVNNYSINGVDDLTKIVAEKFDVEMEGFDNGNQDNMLLNPFFLVKIEKNPFRSNERLYPVDYGAPTEAVLIVNISYPSNIEVVNVPEKTTLALPNAGGRFLLDVSKTENKLTLNCSFTVNKTVFNSTEYHYLKEMYDRIIQIQNTDFLFKKK